MTAIYFVHSASSPYSTTKGNSPSSTLCRADHVHHGDWIPRAVCRTPDSELLKSLIGVFHTLVMAKAFPVPAYSSARFPHQH
jgi:hypothetical protein